MGEPSGGVRAAHPFYKGQRIVGGLRIDLLINGCIVVELKAVERIHPIYLAQVITQLKISGRPAGLLLNFNAMTLTAGLRRHYHPDRYPELHRPHLSG